MTDRQTRASYTIGFRDKSQITVNAQEDFVRLDNPFDPTNTNGVKLPAGGQYLWKSVSAGFVSDIRKLFNYSITGRYGDITTEHG
jgi:hypothetical protein